MQTHRHAHRSSKQFPSFILRVLASILWGSTAALCDVSIDDLLEIEGYVNVGLFASNGGNPFAPSEYRIWSIEGSRITEAELDFTVTAHERIEAQFDIHGDMNDSGLELQKALIEFKTRNSDEFRIGRMKKDFGLEDAHSQQDLLTIKRSYLHSYIESFLALGHDFAFDYQWNQDGSHYDTRTNARISLGSDGDARAFVLIGAEAERTWGTVTVSSMYVHHGTVAETTNFNLAIGSFSHSIGPLGATYEMAAGKDPNATELTIRMGNRRDIWFTGIRAIHSYRWERDQRFIEAIQPILSVVYLAYDLKAPERARLQLVPGLSFQFDPEGSVRWMNNLESVYSVNPPGRGVLRSQYMAFYSQVQISW